MASPAILGVPHHGRFSDHEMWGSGNIDHGPEFEGGNVTEDGRPNNEFAKWMANWSAQIQQHNVDSGHLRQKQTVENGKQKYPDDKPIKLARPKAA